MAFIIKGSFSGTGVNNTTRYWRVNLLKDDLWNIYRNSIYRIKMKDIKTVGWSTPQEAEEEGPVVDPTESSISINIDVAKWDVRVVPTEGRLREPPFRPSPHRGEGGAAYAATDERAVLRPPLAAGRNPQYTSSPPSGRAGGSRGGELWNQ